MVRLTLVLLLVFISLPGWLQAAPSLELSVDKTEIEYGKSMNVIVKASGIAEDLSNIKLTPLEKDFHISVADYTPAESGVALNNAQQSLRLRVTPRSAGVLPLPGLEFSNVSSTAHEINVIDGRAQGKTLSFVQHTGKAEIWARQQYAIWVEIKTPDKFASLRANEQAIPGFRLVPMFAERVQAGKQGDYTLLRAGWLLYGNKPGSYDIALPAIDYMLGGDVERQYYLPVQTIHVKALPPYIPPTMPVGKVEINESLQPSGLLLKDSLAYWHIEMRSADVRPEDFPSLLRQIKSTAELDVLPAEIHREIKPVTGGNNSLVTYDVPLKPRANSFITLPALKVQYFDPDSGKIITALPASRHALSLGMYVWIAILIVILYTGWRLFTLVIALTRQYMTRRKAVALALARLSKANNADELRTALRHYAAAKGWNANIALSDWVGKWRVNKRGDKMFSQSLLSLSQLSYSAHAEGHDLDETRSLLLAALTD